jgi:hypothetical protein
MTAPLPSGHAVEPLLTADQWLAVIAAAAAAPSVHNTQPWRFVVGAEVAELHLDPTRVLPVADPDARSARVSCGAALLNLRVALRASGIETTVSPLPQRTHPTLLAVVRPVRRCRPTSADLALSAAIPRRRSHRRPFHPAPVQQSALSAIVYAAAAEGCYLRLVQDPAMMRSVTALARRADQVLDQDEDYRAELARWTFATGGRTDGVPHTASGPRPEPGTRLPIRDFAPGVHRPVHPYEADPLLGLLMSPGDTALDQVRCGQALERALLVATEHGVGASIISAPIEVPAIRAELRTVTGTSMWPQLLLRLGSALPTSATPRRPVAEIVEHAVRRPLSA